MLTALIPKQYEMLAKIGLALGIALAIFLAGWKVNGWRLGQEIAQLEADLKTATENNATLTASIEEQNGRIQKLKQEGDRRQAAAQDALSAVSSEVATLEGQLETLRQARGKTCADAEALLNEALGL